MGILTLISAAITFLDHLWVSYNGSASVQAKVAQMNQTQKEAHTKLVEQAMHGATSAEKLSALDEIRKLTSE